MRRAHRRPWIAAVGLLATIGLVAPALVAEADTDAGQHPDAIGADQCSASHLGTSINPSHIGERVSAVALTGFTWVAAQGDQQAYCRIDGRLAPIDANAPDIQFGVVLPSNWSRRAVQLGGGGNNGVIPSLVGRDGDSSATYLDRGWATYGSDSGHQNPDLEWSANDEALRNFGYMQLKKTHDAAWVIIERMYGTRPSVSYFVGSSQGGREALTAVQRYGDDYDGVLARVPVVNFSTLQLAAALMAKAQIPLASWVTPAKATAIATEVVRRCDGQDGLQDGVINDYIGCRNLFDPRHDPWAAKRCPGDVDPNPSDTSAAACLTSGQITALEQRYSRYEFATPLADDTTSFGMWVPSIDVIGASQAPHILSQRYAGMEGAAPNAPILSWSASPMVTRYLFGNPSANPLDYVEGGPLNARRVQVSAWLDSTDPELSRFAKQGGKLIVVSGTADTRASSGSQLDYYQSVLDTMGRTAVDAFARIWVMPQGTHGLQGSSYPVTGAGNPTTPFALPSAQDRLGLLQAWVEDDQAPPFHGEVTGGGRSLPLCSYPYHPQYQGSGAPEMATSYRCTPTKAPTPR